MSQGPYKPSLLAAKLCNTMLCWVIEHPIEEVWFLYVNCHVVLITFQHVALIPGASGHPMVESTDR